MYEWKRPKLNCSQCCAQSREYFQPILFLIGIFIIISSPAREWVDMRAHTLYAGRSVQFQNACEFIHLESFRYDRIASIFTCYIAFLWIIFVHFSNTCHSKLTRMYFSMNFNFEWKWLSLWWSIVLCKIFRIDIENLVSCSLIIMNLSDWFNFFKK